MRWDVALTSNVLKATTEQLRVGRMASSVHAVKAKLAIYRPLSTCNTSLWQSVKCIPECLWRQRVRMRLHTPTARMHACCRDMPCSSFTAQAPHHTHLPARMRIS